MLDSSDTTARALIGVLAGILLCACAGFGLLLAGVADRVTKLEDEREANEIYHMMLREHLKLEPLE